MKFETIKIVRFLLLFFLLVRCHDNEVKKIGDDGAVLSHVDLSNAVAIISTNQPTMVTEVDNFRFPEDQIRKIDKNGNLFDVKFDIEGTANGGFDKYKINDVSETYFLLSFFERRESYFVNKKTGDATKSVYVKVNDLSVIQDYFSIYAAYGENDFYYRDVEGKVFKLGNYLDKTSSPIELNFNVQPERFYIDKNGGVYHITQSNYKYDLYAYKNGLSTKIATDYVKVWNDINGDLKIIFANGKIFTALDGILGGEIQFGGKIYEYVKFKTLNVPAFKKTMTVATKEGEGTYLYDLSLNKPVFKLWSAQEYNEIVSIVCFGKYLSILYSDNDKRYIRQIDLSINAYKDFEVQLNSKTLIHNLYALAEDGYMIAVEERNGDFSPNFLKYVGKNGEVNNLVSNTSSGKVIKL